jgi:hypothetical protein
MSHGGNVTDANGIVLEAMRARRAALRRGALPKRIVRIALAVGVVVHLLLGLGLYELMRPLPSNEEPGMFVRILDAPLPEPALPDPPPRQPNVAQQKSISKPVPVPAVPPIGAHAAASAPVPAASEAPALDTSALFNADGSVRIAPAPKASPHEEGMERSRELLARGHNVLHCTQAQGRTNGHHESLGDEVARKYLGLIGLYNAHSEQHTRELEAAAEAACDDLIHKRGSAVAPDAPDEK